MIIRAKLSREPIEKHAISSKVSKYNEMESLLFTKDETAACESLKSLGTVVIQKDSVFTRTNKNSRKPEFTHLCV